MIAGRMRDRLTLYAPAGKRTGSGAHRSDYTQGKTVWAERIRLNGGTTEETGEHFAEYTAEWRIRDRHEVAEGWQVSEMSRPAVRYRVNNIIPNKAKGMLTLACKRINQ